MITRDIVTPVLTLTEQLIGDCSTLDSTNGAVINSDVIDRLGLTRRYYGAQPYAVAKGWGNTSTGDKRITLAVKLQHGDSSGGGDMADLSTESEPAAFVYYTADMTTDMESWSTGIREYRTRPHVYDLRGAKQYVRCGITPTLPGITTSTADGNILRLNGGIIFQQADEAPEMKSGTTSTTT